MYSSKKALFPAFFAIILCILLNSCDMGNSPAINIPQPASELRATSFSPNSIRLSWKPSRTSVIGYDVQVMDEFRSIVKTVQFGRDSIGTIRDLNEGKVYIFRLLARSYDTISRGIEILGQISKMESIFLKSDHIQLTKHLHGIYAWKQTQPPILYLIICQHPMLLPMRM